jgi:integrase
VLGFANSRNRRATGGDSQERRALPASRHVFGQPLGQFRKSWRNACVGAELGKFEKLENAAVVYNGLTFHDLRRSGVRNLIRAGVSEQVAMKISGHKTTSIFRRYNIISGADLRDAAKKLDSYVKREESRFDDSLMENAKLQWV